MSRTALLSITISLIGILLIKQAYSSIDNSVPIDIPEGINIAEYAKEEALKTPLKINVHTQSNKHEGYHVLKKGSIIYIPPHHSPDHLEIFCYDGERKTLRTFFKSIEVHLSINSTSYRHYEGSNSSSVREHYAETRWFSFSPWRTSVFSLDLYSKSCIGIETNESYELYFKSKDIDLVRVACFALAIVLYLLSPAVAHNTLFHYFTGSVIGVLGSLIVVLFVLSKFIPRRSGTVVLLGGSGVIVYVLQYFYESLYNLMMEHYNLVLCYIGVTILLSTIVVYRWGPVSDHRTLKLIQWSLQSIAMSLLFFCSQHKPLSTAACILLLCYGNRPQAIDNRVRKLWQRYRPPKIELLSEEEYVRQGAEETRKALEELRDYCKSPQCNAWSTLRTLRTPQRFAEFVEGSFHVEEREVEEFENSYYGDGFGALSDNKLEYHLTDDEC